MTSKGSEVRALLGSRIDACEAKDIDRLMPLYSSNIVYYDAVPPLQFVGYDEVRRNFLQWFDMYDGPLSLETDGLTIATSGDVAFAHMLHLASGETKGGNNHAIWVRSTVCCQRTSDKWIITHEHISRPISPESSWVEEG